MGNIIPSVNTYNPWKIIEAKRMYLPGCPSVCIRDGSYQEADCYQIWVDSDNKEIREIIQTRLKKQASNVVQLLDVRGKSSSKFLQNCYGIPLYVYTQKIACRLSELRLIQIEKILIMIEVVNGCRQIVALFRKYFRVSQNLVGLNAEGLIKIWFSQNYSSIRQQENSIVDSQYQMVRSCIIFARKQLYLRLEMGQATKLSQLQKILEDKIKMKNINLVRKDIVNKIRMLELPTNRIKQKDIGFKNIGKQVKKQPEKTSKGCQRVMSPKFSLRIATSPNQVKRVNSPKYTSRQQDLRGKFKLEDAKQTYLLKFQANRLQQIQNSWKSPRRTVTRYISPNNYENHLKMTEDMQKKFNFQSTFSTAAQQDDSMIRQHKFYKKQLIVNKYKNELK